MDENTYTVVDHGGCDDTYDTLAEAEERLQDLHGEGFTAVFIQVNTV